MIAEHTAEVAGFIKTAKVFRGAKENARTE